MFDTVIIPLDTSRHAEDAIPVAVAQPRRLHARLVLLHVFARPEPPIQSPEVQLAGPRIRPVAWRKDELERAVRGAQDYLELVKRRYDLPSESVTRVAIGDPVRRIKAETDAWPRPLVVMTTGEPGDHNRAPLSEVARQLLVQGRAPVLGIRHQLLSNNPAATDPA